MSVERFQPGTSPVTFFLHSLAGGGIEKITLQIMARLMQMGFSVELVTVNADGPLREQVPPGCPLIDLRCKRTLTCILPLFRYLLRCRTHIGISSQPHRNLALLFLRRITGWPRHLVVCEHNVFGGVQLSAGRGAPWVLSFLIRTLYPLASRVIVISEEVGVSLRERAGYRGPMELIRNGVPVDEILRLAASDRKPKDEDRPRIHRLVAVGRLVPQKDFATLLQAFALLPNRPAYRLSILGDGPGRGELELQAAELGIGSQVSMPGFLENPYPALSTADIFVSSSRWEGLPIAVLEALALGLPIVATECPGGHVPILKGAPHAYLVAPGDAPAMAHAITVAASRPKDLEGTKHFARQFDLANTAAQYANLIRELQVEVA